MHEQLLLAGDGCEVGVGLICAVCLANEVQKQVMPSGAYSMTAVLFIVQTLHGTNVAYTQTLHGQGSNLTGICMDRS